MIKHIMLGVKGEYCCVLKCLLPFGKLPHELEASDFIHEATNWGGCDKTKRTLKIIKKKPTGRVILLTRPITFNGGDYDSGHEYGWEFTIDRIVELEDA